MSKCVFCSNEAVKKGEKYHTQHCVPEWMTRDLLKKWEESGEEAPKSLTDFVVHGKWCRECENGFSKLDGLAWNILSSRFRTPALLKDSEVIEDIPVKYKKVFGGRSLVIITPEGEMKTGHMVFTIGKVIKTKCTLTYQSTLKKFILSLTTRLSCRDGSGFKTIRDSIGNLEDIWDMDVNLQYLEDEEISNDLMCFPTVEIYNHPSNGKMLIPEMPSYFVAEFMFCGFKFRVIPKEHNGIHNKMLLGYHKRLLIPIGDLRADVMKFALRDKENLNDNTN